MRPTLQPLPIDALVPDILERLNAAGSLVIEAPPGAGKTTRVPPALLSQCGGHVLVLEPRRLAARLAARRVAAERGESLGGTVGYHVRFEQVGGPDTRLHYLTEGVLTRRLLGDPLLRGVDTVVLDEFHERHLEGDLALALLRRLQRAKRPELKLVVMSATLEGLDVARFLGDCPVLRSEGRLYPLSVSYTPHSAEALEEQVAGALRKLLVEGADGDVLVFLPGAAEIRRAARACEALAARAGMVILPLHGDLTAEEQDRAVAPAPQPKLILSTNVAESSVTIEGVTAVIDSGVARRAGNSPWSGLPVLTVSRVSKASVRQRAGRAGRTRPGRVIRLFPEEDFLRRPDHDPPEITRRELSQMCLELHAAGLHRAHELDWLDAPPPESLHAAEELLERLGAIDAGGRLTGDGRRMAMLPVPPRLGRLMLEADRLGSGREGCELAALLSSGERLPAGSAGVPGRSDLLLLHDSAWSSQTHRVAAQLRRSLRPRRGGPSGDEALLMAVLAAFPDRVAKRRKGCELALAAGGPALLADNSVVRDDEWLVAVDAEWRPESGTAVVRLASAVEPEWLMEMFPGRFTEKRSADWNRRAERVENRYVLLFDGLTVEERSGGSPDPLEASALLAERALEQGIQRFAGKGDWEEFLARLTFAAAHSDLPEPGPGGAEAALAQMCTGLRSFAELEQAASQGGFLNALRAKLTRQQLRLLDEIAPAMLRLPRGRRCRVHYEPGKPPWIASRLQDFFGMRETPRLARGEVEVVLHLLAPNQRPVQTTTDLAGFWERLYPQVRRELRRRYPKHAWPEDPLA